MPVPTIPVEGQYSSPPPIYSPTTTPPPAGNYPNNGFTIIMTTTCTVTATDIIGNPAVNGNEYLNCSPSGGKPDNGAIIALGVVCGLLVIGGAILLLLLLGKRNKTSAGQSYFSFYLENGTRGAN
jgi:hypothetical protein